MKAIELTRRAVKKAIRRREAKEALEMIYWAKKMQEVKEGKYDLYKEIK